METTHDQNAPTTTSAQQQWGHIKSFVPQRAHTTPSQKQAIDTLLPVWGIDYAEQLLNFDEVFGRHAPTILEIGFGMGETTQKIATDRAGDNFLALEVYPAGVGSLLKKIHDSGLTNIRIMQHDAVDVVNHMIPLNSLQGVHIYFPDPWHKKRHHKRRLIQAPFVKLLSSRLVQGGYIHCATDWEDYAVQMLDVLSHEPSLQNTANGYAPKPDYRPQTKFETRGLRLGHGVWDLVFVKK